MMRAGPRTFTVVSQVALLLMAMSAVELLAQAVTVHRAGGALAVRAPTFTFVKGEPLVRLKDGRALRVDLDLSVLPGPGGVAAAQARQVFILSYDLWEERFAVTQVGVPSRSIANRTAGEVEGWCLEQLTVPIASLGPLATDRPFWIQLASRVLDGDSAPGGGEAEGFTLRALIDALSLRRKDNVWTHSVEAGPFRLGS
jgi:hypothetical protein